MNILHLYESSILEQIGGTERFLHEIARRQVNRGHRVHVLYYSNAARSTELDGVIYQTTTATFRSALTRRERLSCLGVEDRSFPSILREVSAEIVHLHGDSVLCGIPQIQSAARAGIGCLTSLHTPSFLCPNTTLINQANQVCDGVVDVTRCTRCRLARSGVPDSLAVLFSRWSLPEATATTGSTLSNLSTSRLATLWHRNTLSGYSELPMSISFIHRLKAWRWEFGNGHPEEKMIEIPYGDPVGQWVLADIDCTPSREVTSIRFVFFRYTLADPLPLKDRVLWGTALRSLHLALRGATAS